MRFDGVSLLCPSIPKIPLIEYVVPAAVCPVVDCTMTDVGCEGECECECECDDSIDFECDLAFSAALFLTILLIDETEGMLS